MQSYLNVFIFRQYTQKKLLDVLCPLKVSSRRPRLRVRIAYQNTLKTVNTRSPPRQQPTIAIIASPHPDPAPQPPQPPQLNNWVPEARTGSSLPAVEV